MKNILTTLLTIFVATTAFSQLTFVPDDNFEQALIDLGYDTAPLDDFVLTANIETVTDLDVSSLGIIDITGIEDFVSLANLSCQSNQLTSLDLTQNINLVSFIGSQNQLTTVNINNNLQLQSFICVGNQLTNLDVSQNALLESIIILDNQIVDLDLTQNPLLVTLSAPNNLINNIDLSQNTLLQTINLDNNQLTNIDLSQNQDLLLIFCENNQLTSADIRNGANENINIEFDYFRMTNNPNLICIFVDDAAYSTENWSEVDPTSTFVETEAECAVLAVEDFEESTISVYPNPAKNVLHIKTPVSFNKVEIYTIQGQKVLENTSESIDVSILNAGVYMLVIEVARGDRIVKRFIKK